MRSKALVSALVLWAIALSARDARAVDREACFSAHEDGQAKRAKGALSEARAEFMTCSDAGCPNAVRADCAGWVVELDAAQPTVMFVVTDASGADVVDVKISVDGKPVLSKLDGNPTPLDPGAHELRFEAAGAPAQTEQVVIRQGEKNRRIEVKLGAGAPSAGGRAGAPAGGGGAPSASESSSDGPSIHPAAWVLGGVGVAGIGVFAVLAGLGKSELSDAEETCAPSCTDADLDPIKTKYLAGDISLFVGLGALTAGVVVAIVSLTATPSGDAPAATAVELRLMPTLGGAYLGVEGTFL